jgi:outer membrane protein assembly factor BamB
MRRSTLLVSGAFVAAFAVPLALSWHFLVWTAWSVPLAAPVAAGPLLAGDLLLVALADGTLLALGAEDGSLRWRGECGAPPAREALAASASDVACAGGGQFALFDAASGEARFRQDARMPVAAVAVADALLIATQGDRVEAFAAQDGAPRWSATPWPGREIAALRAVNGSLLAVGTGGAAALDLASGALRWQLDLGAPVASAPEPGDEEIFLLDAGTPPRVHAVARGSGLLLWSGEGETVPVRLGDVAVDASGETLRARDARSGAPIWEKMGFQSAWSAAPVRAGERVVAGFGNALFGFRLGGRAAFTTIRPGALGARLAGDAQRVYYVEGETSLVALDVD